MTKIHCSTMKRGHETARILARHHAGRPLLPAHLLRECLPSMPARLRKDSPGITVEVMRRGERSVERAYRRYFRRPARKSECHVLVSHGNLIRSLIGRVLRLHEHAWCRLGTSHCGITIVRIPKEGPILLDCYNDTGHLPPGMRTSGTRRGA